MILEHEESYYLDMTDYEPDGPKASSFYFYPLDELLDKYTTFRLNNWLLKDSFDGVYPIIPICSTPDNKIIFLVTEKNLDNASPIFLASEYSADEPCVQVADDFNQFLNQFVKSKGFPILKVKPKASLCKPFMKEKGILTSDIEKVSDKETIVEYSARIKLFPDDAWLYCTRGNAYQNTKQTNRALRDYNKAIKLKDEESFFYYCRGDLILSYGSPRKALIDLDVAVKLEPENDVFRWGRAEALNRLGKLEKALHDCNIILTNDPHFVLALYTRCKIFEKLGNDEKAKADIETLNAINNT